MVDHVTVATVTFRRLWACTLGLMMSAATPASVMAGSLPPGIAALAKAEAKAKAKAKAIASKKKRPRSKKANKRSKAPPPVGPTLQLAEAEVKRTALAEAAGQGRASGNLGDAATVLELGGTELGDPLTLLDAAELRLELAERDRSDDAARLAVTDAQAAIDILYFVAAVAEGKTRSAWHIIDPSQVAPQLARGESVIAKAEALVAKIEAERTPPPAQIAAGDKASKRGRGKRERAHSKRGDGTAMIAVGSIAVVAGVGGIALGGAGLAVGAAKQKEVDDLTPDDPKVDDLDRAGYRANLLGYVGFAVAGAGLAIGLPLVIVGAKRRNKARHQDTKNNKDKGDEPRPHGKSTAFAPLFGPRMLGMQWSGRF